MRATPSYPQISTRSRAITRNCRVQLCQALSQSSSKAQPAYLSARGATSVHGVIAVPDTLVYGMGKRRTPQNIDNSSSVQ